MRLKRLALALSALGVIGGVVLIADSNKAPPLQGQEPAKDASPQREVYFPNSEKLGAEEMRVISCGTGMQLSRRGQASTCFLVELGNGDKFLFDVGTGSAANIGSLEIPYDYLDKLFLTHLHSDHFGDFGALYINGWGGGRQGNLRVWGPSGAKPEHGTQYAVTKWREALTWDVDSRSGFSPPAGGEIEIKEFDYKNLNKPVFQEKGVTVRSWPAVHVLDGPVSYSLEWKGLKFVFSGDTIPNKWFDEYGRKADLAIHECMPALDVFVRKLHVNPSLAVYVKEIHTLPAAFGAIMSRIKPRMAVAYHFLNDPDTRYDIHEQIRRTYQGPLTMANDLVCWNITKDRITVRQVVANDRAWPAAPPRPPTTKPDPKKQLPLSPFIVSGRMEELNNTAIKADLDTFKKKYGIKDKK
jgi:ribonuclease Z